jgi:uncharacterized membrane protein
MRIASSIACSLLISACGAPEQQVNNGATASQPAEQPDAAMSEPVRNEPQADRPTHQPQGNACRTQDGEALTHAIKAVGTEPFWAAEIEGRCVTYKTPDDQQSTRVWTRVRGTSAETAWDGALHGKQFQLTVKPKADCSDGMSDKVYSLEAVLRVDGEVRHGCAEQR